jgi:polyisoprenoid-binding protein YceI
MLIILSAGSSVLHAQKFMARNGHISFNASTPLENIDAVNNQAASVMDASTGEILFNVLIKSFQFKVALMQEHFNENYMESDKYPKASFKGKITNVSAVNFSKDGNYDVELTGDMTIHGVTKPLTTKGVITVKNGVVGANSKFVVKPADYNIQIPKLVEAKIAREANVNVDITYQKL